MHRTAYAEAGAHAYREKATLRALQPRVGELLLWAHALNLFRLVK